MDMENVNYVEITDNQDFETMLRILIKNGYVVCLADSEKTPIIMGTISPYRKIQFYRRERI